MVRLEALRNTPHVVTQLHRKCYNCHERGHVRRECPALRTHRNKDGKETEYISSLRCQLVELRRQLEHEHSLRMRLDARTSQLEVRSADERRNRVTESCGVDVSLSFGIVSTRVGEEGGRRRCVESSGSVVETDGRRRRCVESSGSVVETDGRRRRCVESSGSVVETDGRRRRCAESSDEGINLGCGDPDDVVEGRGMIGSLRHLGRERHQPVRLVGQPSQLLETRDPAAVVVARRRCLPIVPARENSGDVDLSAEAVRGRLLKAFDRSRGEHSGETSRRDAGWHPGPLGLPRSVWAQ